MKFVVGTVDELEEGRLMADLPDGEQVLIVEDGGKLYALAALCPHQFAPLIGGDVEDGVLVCPLHGWRFALHDGNDPDNPYICVRTWDVGRDGDQIWVETGAAAG
ncbi:MAG: Rieske (2Fe-2S) protein [Deltaproteobacteria bacterium]|nr:Rieske (2Fe-2S) protein [Deltaproteobacteria bacterium]